MPRKKKLDETAAEPTPVVENPPVETKKEEPKPKPSRRRAPVNKAKPVEVEPPIALVESEPEPIAHAESAAPTSAPKRSRPKKTAPPKQSPKVEPTSEEQTTSEPEAGPEPAAVVESSSAPKKSRSRSRNKKTAATEPLLPAEAVADVEEGDAWGEELPVPIWRPRQAKSLSEPAESAAVDDQEEDKTVRKRRSRRRRGGKGEDAPIDGEADTPLAVEVAAEEPSDWVGEPEVEFRTPPATKERGRERDRTPKAKAEPAPAPPVVVPRPEIRVPKRPVFEIPETAPQVVLRDGIPTIVRNHRVYPPMVFFGSPADERRANIVLEEMRLAAEAGVHLHSFLIEFLVEKGAVDDSIALAGYLLKKALEVDPEAQVIFRVAFAAPRSWEDRYPNARYKDAARQVAEPSVCDDHYWGVASECLERFVRQLRLLEAKDSILGVHLERGEWFLAHDAGYDTSNAARLKFRDWARTRYLNDEVTLRASWFDGNVRFDNIVVPEFQPEGEEGERFVRSSRRQRRYVDYHLFLSDATVNRISELANTVKVASEGFFLVGVSYGYTFEWSHPSSSHLSLGKLLRAPEIDFIAGPPSYRSREPGGTSAFPSPIDSFALNGKLYISEEDFKTSLSQGHEPDDFNPPLKTPQALDSVHWRGVGAGLSHTGGVAWMDLWGNGWLRSHSVWERAARVQEALVMRMGVQPTNPEVAIFIDERALAYLVDENAFTLLVQNARESVLRAGVSAAFYLLSDLQHREKFPESKLYLFLNAWDIRPELRAAIKTRLQRDNKVLFWLYSAGLFDAGRDSLERAREVTGIALKPQPFYSKSGTTILNRRHPLAEAFPDRTLTSGSKLEPSYFAIPEGATVLGEYTQTGLPSYVVKEFKEEDSSQHWTSVFLGEPLVNPALIRALAQMAGAHVYNFQNDVTHVRPPFLTVHCTGTGPRTVTLPDKSSAYNLLTQQWAAIDSTNLRFNALDGSTHVFLVGSREELEHVLNLNPSELLQMANLPPRDPNSLLDDASNFDVPVMKLDEWIETSDGDEVADDWFLRAPQVVEEPEQATMDEDRPGRRRRRRRGGRGNGRGSEEVVDARAEPSGTPTEPFDSLGMNVVFRRRD